MTNKKLYSFESQLAAQAFAQILTNDNIKFASNPKPLEYSQIITGGNSRMFDLYVNVEDFDKARALLEPFLNKATTLNIEPQIPPNYFRKVIILNLLGFIVLPPILNLISIFSYREMLKQKQPIQKIIFATLMLFGGFLLSGLIIYFILTKAIFSSLSI